MPSPSMKIGGSARKTGFFTFAGQPRWQLLSNWQWIANPFPIPYLPLVRQCCGEKLLMNDR
jgi:hypothetical protein